MAGQENGMYVANRNVRVATSKGYIITFKKDEPKFIPPLIREEMLQYGILPVSGELPTQEAEVQMREPIGEERNRRIYEAVVQIVGRNNPDEFTAGGIPKEDAVFQEGGFRVSRREIREAFSKYRQYVSEQE